MCRDPREEPFRWDPGAGYDLRGSFLFVSARWSQGRMCDDSLIYFFWGENILKWQNYNDGDLDIDNGGDE